MQETRNIIINEIYLCNTTYGLMQTNSFNKTFQQCAVLAASAFPTTNGYTSNTLPELPIYQLNKDLSYSPVTQIMWKGSAKHDRGLQMTGQLYTIITQFWVKLVKLYLLLIDIFKAIASQLYNKHVHCPVPKSISVAFTNKLRGSALLKTP